MDHAPPWANEDQIIAPPVRALSPGIRRALEHIEANFTDSLTLLQLARLCELSLHRFATTFREQVGLPPHRYQCRLRVRQARRLLREGWPPAEAAVEAGFFDQSHLSRHFKRVYGVTPGHFAGRCAMAGDAVPELH